MAPRENIRADNFEVELQADLPEVAPELRALRDNCGGDEPGLHIVVGDVLGPYVVGTVGSGDGDRLKAVCAFMERMATSPDERLRNALTVSVLERLGDDREQLEQARLAMGPETLSLSHEIERFWGRET
jgi:hypothetical protein